MKDKRNFGYNMDAVEDTTSIFGQEEWNGLWIIGCRSGAGHQLLLLLGGVLQSGTPSCRAGSHAEKLAQ
jgi:hypothetical protein